MTWLLVKLGVRLVAFTLVFWFATRPRRDKGKLDKHGQPAVLPPRISIQPRWAIALIGVLFAALNSGLYWIARPVLNLATLGTFSWIMPLVVNGLILWGTARIVRNRQWMRIDGWTAGAWLALVLTLAHGVLYLTLDYLPAL